MALRGCLRCVKYFVFLLNFIIWVSGLLLLGGAIYMRMDRFANYVIMTSYTQHVTTYHMACYIFMGVGGMMTFIGFLGCCSAFHESRTMLGSFFVCLMFLLILQLGAGALAFLYRNEAPRDIPVSMKKYVQSVYGKDHYTDEPMDFLQRSLHCCGAAGPGDWLQSMWYNSTSPQTGTYPLSCCQGGDKPPQGGFKGVICVTNPSDFGYMVDPLQVKYVKGIWLEGCSNILVKNLQFRVFIASIVFLALTTEQVISLCLSITLCCAMRREAAGGYKS